MPISEYFICNYFNIVVNFASILTFHKGIAKYKFIINKYIEILFMKNVFKLL